MRSPHVDSEQSAGRSRVGMVQFTVGSASCASDVENELSVRILPCRILTAQCCLITGCTAPRVISRTMDDDAVSPVGASSHALLLATTTAAPPPVATETLPKRRTRPTGCDSGAFQHCTLNSPAACCSGHFARQAYSLLNASLLEACRCVTLNKVHYAHLLSRLLLCSDCLLRSHALLLCCLAVLLL